MLTNVTKTQRNEVFEKTTPRVNSHLANETTRKSHTVQLTMLQHVGGLAAARTARKTDSVSAVCSSNQIEFVLTSGVVVVEARGRPHHDFGSWEPRGVRRISPSSSESRDKCTGRSRLAKMRGVCV